MRLQRGRVYDGQNDDGHPDDDSCVRMFLSIPKRIMNAQLTHQKSADQIRLQIHQRVADLIFNQPEMPIVYNLSK